jgi:hypothetical protein
MDMVESEDEALGCGTWTLNFLHYFVPDPLATSNQELPTRRRRKPWRYRWPDDFRDEVLARLLELNRQRAEEERLSGAAAQAKPRKPKKPARKPSGPRQMGMF